RNRAASVIFPLFVIGAVLMMIIPVSPVVLDIFLAANIAIAILVLLTVVLMQDVLEFSVFPSLLLVLTLVRLALNVSSTRLILLDGYAGKVIETFGNFVVGGSVIVGLVVFLILIVIQFAVITNGAGRVAEVSARFTLDAMPGKQMAIDADLSSGLLDEKEARKARARIAKEADFYGAMDGASKFVKGDVMAGVIIVLINLFGGFAVGMGKMGLSFGDALSQYSILTVGDGLVSQIPAILTSIATGLLITRVASESDLGEEVAQQLFGAKRAMRISAFVIIGISLLPGLPKIPFWTFAAGLYIAGGRAGAAADAASSEDELEVEIDRDDPEALIGEMRVEPLEIHLAYDILDLIDPTRGGDLLDRVKALRRQIAMELGFVMPLVRTRDDLGLAPETYQVILDGADVASGMAPRNRVLALPAGDGEDLRAMGGIEAIEPVFGLTAFWVDDSNKPAAAATGATVVDRSSVLVTHLAEIVRRNAGRLLTRQDVQLLVDGLRYDHPILVKDIDNDVLPLSTLHAVLRALLDDGVSIRHLGKIVEALATQGGETRSLDQLVGTARVALAPGIAARLAPDGSLAILSIDPAYETGLHEHIRDIDGDTRLVMDPQKTEVLFAEVQQAVDSAVTDDVPLAIVCGQLLRRPLQRLLASFGVDVAVIGYPELAEHLELTTVGVIGTPALTTEAGSVS
ncbi:MAG: flagellar biosynthesis protein FlhA, partial [Acidimicrobiales bacterium]